MRIREYIDTDWPSVWPIFREIVAAGETFAYDPGWSSEQAQLSRRRRLDVLLENEDAVIPRSGWIHGRRCYLVGEGTTDVISTACS